MNTCGRERDTATPSESKLPAHSNNVKTEMNGSRAHHTNVINSQRHDFEQNDCRRIYTVQFHVSKVREPM